MAINEVQDVKQFFSFLNVGAYQSLISTKQMLVNSKIHQLHPLITLMKILVRTRIPTSQKTLLPISSAFSMIALE